MSKPLMTMAWLLVTLAIVGASTVVSTSEPVVAGALGSDNGE